MQMKKALAMLLTFLLLFQAIGCALAEDIPADDPGPGLEEISQPGEETPPVSTIPEIPPEEAHDTDPTPEPIPDTPVPEPDPTLPPVPQEPTEPQEPEATPWIEYITVEEQNDPATEAPASPGLTAAPPRPVSSMITAENPQPGLSFQLEPDGVVEDEYVTAALTITNSGNVTLTLRNFSIEPQYSGQNEAYDAWSLYTDRRLDPDKSVVIGLRIRVLPQDALQGKANRVAHLTSAYSTTAGETLIFESNPISLSVPLTGFVQNQAAASRMALYVAPLNAAGQYALDPTGKMTKPAEYLFTVINGNSFPAFLAGIRMTVNGTDFLLPSPSATLAPGEAVSFQANASFTADQCLPDSATEDTAGRVEATFIALQAAEAEGDAFPASNAVSLSHVLLPSQTGYTPWQEPDSGSGDAPYISCEVVSSPENGESFCNLETITYQAAVVNPSSLPMKNVTIYAFHGGPSQYASLAHYDLIKPGEMRFVTGDYTVTPEDGNLGCVYNIAYAVWEANEPGEFITAISEPVLTPMEKSQQNAPAMPIQLSQALSSQPANGVSYGLGEAMEITTTLKNVSNTVLTNVYLYEQDEDGALLQTASREKIATEMTLLKSTYRHIITLQDIQNGSFTHTVFASVQNTKGTDNKVFADTLDVAVSTDARQYGGNGVLLLSCQESSAPENRQYYTLGEIIRFTVTAANLSDEPLTDLRLYSLMSDRVDQIERETAQLEPGAMAEWNLAYAVKDSFLKAGSVAQQAFIRYTSAGQSAASLVTSPLILCKITGDESEMVGAVDFAADDAGCMGSLIAKGSSMSEFAWQTCPTHTATAQAVDALTSGIMTDEEKSAAWQQAKETWKTALNAEYQEIFAASQGEARAAVQNAYLQCTAYLEDSEALLSAQHPEDEVLQCRLLCQQMEEMCLRLCSAFHAPDQARLDSLTSGRYAMLSSNAFSSQCARIDVLSQTSGSHYRVDLCKNHAVTEEQVMTLLKSAGNADVQISAWRGAQRLWQQAMDQDFVNRRAEADESIQHLMLSQRLAFDQYLTAHAELFGLCYPSFPEITEELVTRMISDNTEFLCEAQ